MRPTDEQLRELYRQESSTQEAQESLPVDLLKAQGWTDEMISRIKEDIPLALGRK
jgi:hypothetical protein